MNTNHKLLTAAGLLAAPALLSALPVRDRIAFAPTAGASVSMTYTMVSENSLDDMSMSMNSFLSRSSSSEHRWLAVATIQS